MNKATERAFQSWLKASKEVDVDKVPPAFLESLRRAFAAGVNHARPRKG